MECNLVLRTQTLPAILPNGTMITVGGGLGGRMGLLNATGDNANGVILPANPVNGNVTYPVLLANPSAAYYAEAHANLTKGLPVNDGFPHALYPFCRVVRHLRSSNVFTPEDIYSNRGLLLGPMRVNESFYILSSKYHQAEALLAKTPKYVM